MAKTVEQVKNNPEIGPTLWPEDLIKYIKPIIEPTGYHILYQEQIMFIGKAIGDFNNADLNDFRNFVSKGYKIVVDDPKKFKMWKEKFYSNFIKNGMKKGISAASLENIWMKMKKFSSYSFVKAHATSYAYNSFMCSYLAHNHPIEWYTAMLRHENTVEFLPIIKKQIEELKLDINIIMPKLNNIYVNPTAIENNIILGISQIKGIGNKAAEELAKITSHYNSFDEFMKSTEYSKRAVNKGVIIKLITIGFFSDIETDKGTLLRRYETSLMKKKNIIELDENNYLQKLYDFEGDEQLFFYQKELEMIGTPLSEFPYHKAVSTIHNFMYYEVKAYSKGKEPNMKICAGLEDVRVKKTKTGKQYYTIKLRTIEGEIIWCNMFDRAISETKIKWNIDVGNGKQYKNELFMFYFTEAGGWKNFLALVPIKKFLGDGSESK